MEKKKFIPRYVLRFEKVGF